MRGLSLIVGMAALAACSRTPDPAASDAWVRLAAVPGRPAAAYFTLHGGDAPVRLNAVEAKGVARAEMHQSRATANGMMTMDAVGEIEVPANGAVRFEPAGYHVMLFGLPATVKPGGTLPLTLRFGDGRATTVDARVVSAGEAGPR